MSVAEMILQQLGGHRFVVMTGAKQLIEDGDSLRMTIGKNSSKANRLTVTLDRVTDTYKMRFYRYTAGRLNKKTYAWTPDKVAEVAEFDNVYCDQLQDLFTQVTGMYTSL